MRVRLPRLVRLGLPAVAALALALGGCGDQPAPAPAAPPASSAPASSRPASSAPASSAPASSAPASSGPARATLPSAGTAGSDGLTVRYLGDDGTVQTVPVEDFPR